MDFLKVGIIWMFSFVFVLTVDGQSSFSISFSQDSLLVGNSLEVIFEVENLKGNFIPPDLSHLPVVSGPNTSSSTSIVNGEYSSFASYSYILYPEDVGEIIIPPAYFETLDETLETEPQTILVLPNPKGIIQESRTKSRMFKFDFSSPKPPETPPASKSKKKRKLKKF